MNVLGRFGTKLSQHARLVTLASAQDGTLPEALMAERVRGREAVGELYTFEVDALSTSTDLDLEQFIGEELTVTLLQPDDTRRAWHGLCTCAEWIGADGGVARYRLWLEPALALLRLRRDSYIFQDKNVQDIVTELFSDYPQLRFEFDLTQPLAVRPVCTQYRESDYDFFVRLMASEGLSWRFEHDQAPPTGDGQARHKLLIFDSQAEALDTPGDPVLRFHGVRATDSDDAIDAFAARRRVAANAVTISSWDPAQLLAPNAELASTLDAGELPPLAVYDGSGDRIASDGADDHAQLMLRALELDNKLFEGQGAVRRMAPGHRFELARHERYPEGENAFKTLWVEHEARNNIDAGIASGERTGWIEPGTYRNRFGCVRDAVPIVPRATALPHPYTALGPQTALVVGVQDATATTVRDHQVRVQFAWQRGQGSNPGGLAHDVDERGAAPGDERSGTWVRVAEALAGPNWGSQFTPRIGTEVLVDFLENDIDRPLVVAQLYTGADVPPFSAGVDSGVNHAGTISGIHTRGFDGGGYNQWQLDDTRGQLRMRLASSSANTQLNLGYLIAQSPGGAQRGNYRGSGFELRTDAWATVRGAEGVLLTTHARAAKGSGVTSTQMDAAESLALLKAVQALDTTLLDAATGQHALTSKASREAQKAFMADIDPKEKGKYEGAVNGQDALKARADARDLDSGAPVERFAAPHVLMDGPANINWATPASTVLFAGQQLHWTTQGDTHMSAAYTVSSVAAEAAGLYAHEGGIQAIAGNGPVSLEAHTDQLEILADKEVVVVSANDSIEIKAKQKIVLQAGQSSITLDGGNITFACPGEFSVKGSQHIFDAGASKAALPASLPDTRLKLFDEAFVLKDEVSGLPLAAYAYRIVREDGSIERGVTDEAGTTHLVKSAQAEPLQIQADQAPDEDTAVSPLDNPVCWIEDYEIEIAARSFGRYYVTSNIQGSQEKFKHEIASHYKLYVPARSGPEVVVELRCAAQHVDAETESENADAPASPSTYDPARLQAAMAAFEDAVYSTWNNQFRIKLEDPECGTKTLPIRYEIVWVETEDGEQAVKNGDIHYVINFNESKVHEHVEQNSVDLNYTTTRETFAHEFIHFTGVPDEYGKPKGSASLVRYYQPDGKLAPNMVVFSMGFKKQENDARWNIMSSNDSVKVELRHAWNIAIEVQELMRKKTGRKVTCDIVPA